MIPDTPVRVEYALTKKGRALAAAFDAIAAWSQKWIEPEAAAARPEKVTRMRRRG